MGSDWCRDISFMNLSRQISTSVEDRVKLTRILKSGQGRGSVFLDISNREEALTNILQLIAQQYPSLNGVLIRHDKGMAFLEINFDESNPGLTAIIDKSVTFNDQSVVILCIPLRTKANVVYIRLYNLPLCTKDSLRGLLKFSLEKYGNVLDVGMLLEPTSNTYMGIGYAIINTEYNSKEPLAHKIKGPENKMDAKEEEAYNSYILFILNEKEIPNCKN